METPMPRLERCITALCGLIAVAIMAWWCYRVVAAAQPVQMAAVSCEAVSANGAAGQQACAGVQSCAEPCDVATLFRRTTGR
jgi:hypothetical protein